MIFLETCPICNGQKIRRKIECIDFYTSKESFWIVSCETCEFTFTNPRPEEKELGEY